jgi:hypothetical protein
MQNRSGLVQRDAAEEMFRHTTTLVRGEALAEDAQCVVTPPGLARDQPNNPSTGSSRERPSRRSLLFIAARRGRHPASSPKHSGPGVTGATAVAFVAVGAVF